MLIGDLAIGAGYQFLDHRYAKHSTDFPNLDTVRTLRDKLADFQMVVYAMLLHHKGVVAIPYSVVQSLELGGELEIISDDERKTYFVRRKEAEAKQIDDTERTTSDEQWW